MQKISNITKERFKFIQFVLDRDNIEYSIQENTDNTYTVNLPNSTEEDVEIINEDADCEVEREELGTSILILPLRTIKNPEKEQRLLKLYNKHGYGIYSKDQKAHDEYLKTIQ